MATPSLMKISKGEEGRPVLVGTTTEVSELLSRMLNMRKIPHNVLNIKQHQREAEIEAQSRTKRTNYHNNMAGQLRKHQVRARVRDLGGLAIIGSEGMTLAGWT